MITFTAQNVDMPQINRLKVSQWINQVAAYYGLSVGQVNYIFCDDDHILEVNKEFLSHDYYTDIITFDYSTGTQINGDIVISLDTVKSNAALLSQNYEQELHRVIIHGVLHLTGQADKTPEAERIMHAKEDHALSLLFK